MQQRRHKRFPLTGSAEFAYEGGAQKNSRAFHALISDVSLSGIGLYLDIPAHENRDVSLTISFIARDGAIKNSAVRGRIVYTRNMGNMHYIGIEFSEEISSANQPSLYEHLASLL